MPRLPFPLAAHVEYVGRAPVPVAKFQVQLRWRNLWRLHHRQAGLPPSGQTTRQTTAQVFNAHARKPQPGFLNLRIGVANQHWLRMNPQNAARPRSKLARERNADRPRNMSRGELLTRTNVKQSDFDFAAAILPQQRLDFRRRKR